MLTWDVTAPDTLAQSHLPGTSLEAGSAAESASHLKHVKYADITRSHDFVAVAVETLGPVNKDGQAFLQNLGQRLSAMSGDPRESAFLFQRISIIMQRSNASSILGSFLPSETRQAHTTY